MIDLLAETATGGKLWDGIPNILGWIAGIIGSLATIFGAVYGIWKIVKKLLDHFEKISELFKVNKDIHAELKPNGGTSLRDSVNRIEGKVGEIDEKVLSQASIQDAYREDGSIAIFECDKEGKNTYSNRTYCRWVGATKGELMGYGWRNFAADYASRDDYDEEWREGFAEEREVEFTFVMKHKLTNKIVYADVHAYPIFNSNHELEKYLGLMYRVEDEQHLMHGPACPHSSS